MYVTVGREVFRLRCLRQQKVVERIGVRCVCLQEEAVEFQPMSRLETSTQLRRQELHGERGERRLL